MVPAERTSLAAQWWRAWTRPALGLLYPAACVCCGDEFDEHPPEPLVCQQCFEGIASGYVNACPRCAMPLAGAPGQAMACAECHHRRHRFEAATAVGKYEGTLRHLVLRAKSGADDALALALGDLLCQRLADLPAAQRPEAVVPVPVPYVRRLLRAANVADILSEVVAHRLDLPRLPGVLRYRRMVRKQSSLTVARRRRNIHKAMAATEEFDLRGVRLLVVDDVLTTGATADEVARALLAAGAQAISVAVVARGIGFD